MSLSLEDRFHKAVDFLQNTPESSAYSPDVDQKLRFYSLFKQSTVGPCKAKKPSFYDMVGKAKWDAWDKLRNMSKETAMTQYIDEIILICKKINTKDGNEMLNILVQQPPPPPPQQQQQVRSKKHTSPSPTEKQTSRTISSPPTTAAPVDLYVDLASQPSRAVLWFCIATAIPHNVNIIKLGAREQRKDSYKEINPFQKVPAMVTGSGFKVFESHAILKYLAHKHRVPEHWYPRNLRKRTLVDRYLDWHHLNTRKGAAGLVWNKRVARMLGVPVLVGAVEQSEKDCAAMLTLLNDVWLGEGKPFLVDLNESAPKGTARDVGRPSIADLLAYCELSQLRLLDYDFSPYANVVKWQKRVRASVPGHDDVHSAIDTMCSRAKL
eukprot:TRINITY_DN165_c1_g1_i1.p1 TRINITY_DN165_c1_g1~~TRINITY_DN165_c1_g1_i1.p1  ORF type:complete len:411 (+),score=92.18 TRINITY_DN165_c1_g1_i1:95-1234(+)